MGDMDRSPDSLGSPDSTGSLGSEVIIEKINKNYDYKVAISIYVLCRKV